MKIDEIHTAVMVPPSISTVSEQSALLPALPLPSTVFVPSSLHLLQMAAHVCTNTEYQNYIIVLHIHVLATFAPTLTKQIIIICYENFGLSLIHI